MTGGGEPTDAWARFWREAGAAAGLGPTVPEPDTPLDALAPDALSFYRLLLFAEHQFALPLPCELIEVLDTCDDLYHLVQVRREQEHPRPDPQDALRSLEDFLQHLAATWTFVGATTLDADRTLDDDLGLDSLGRLQLLLLVEDLGVTLDELAFERCRTLADLYHLATSSPVTA